MSNTDGGARDSGSDRFGPLGDAPTRLQRSFAKYPPIGYLVFCVIVECVVCTPIILSVVTGGMAIRTALLLCSGIFVLMMAIVAVGASDWAKLPREQRSATVVKYFRTPWSRPRAVTPSSEQERDRLE